MAAVASQRSEPASRRSRTGRAAIAEHQQVQHHVGVNHQVHRASVRAEPGHHVEAEQPAFDRAVPHRDAARFLQPHAARQLEVGREHPGRPAGVVLLPVRGELGEEVAGWRSFSIGALAAAAAAAGDAGTSMRSP
jgi:hypothetical protein